MSFVALKYLDAERTIIQAERADGTLKIIEPIEEDLFLQAVNGQFGEIAEFIQPSLSSEEINEERDRRIRLFVWNNNTYQMDESSQQLIIAAGADARFAVANGAQVGDFRWADPNNDFSWWDIDNIRHNMDAHEMSSFSDAAKRWVADHRRTARDIKDQIQNEDQNAPTTIEELQENTRWP